MKIRRRSPAHDFFAGLLGGLLGLTLGMGAGCRSRPAAEVEFAPGQPDPAQIQAVVQRDRQELAKAPPPGETERKLVDLWKRVNTLGFARETEQKGAEQDQAMGSLRIVTGRILQDQGVGALRLICLRLVEDFEKDFQALIQAAVSPDITTALLSGAPPPPSIRPQYTKLVETAGDFVLHAANAGLLKQSRDGRIELPEGAQLFLRIAFKVRFGNIVPEVTTPLQWLLSDFERKWYYRWVIERSRTSSLQRRLDAIDALQSLEPGYPDDAARGIVLFKAQKFEQARLSFEQALKKNPQDPRVQAFLKAASRSGR